MDFLKKKKNQIESNIVGYDLISSLIPALTYSKDERQRRLNGP